jgi:hypothetical protein
MQTVTHSVKTPCLFLISMGLVFCASRILMAEPASATRAALKAQMHKAIDAEDWEAVDNLRAALVKLDASLREPQALKPGDEATSSEPAKEDLFKQLARNGFRLKLAPDDDNPAKFAFSRDIHTGAKTVFAADFFLSWTMPDRIASDMGWRKKTWDLNAETSVQGKLTSDNDTDTDAWRYRVTLKGRNTWNSNAIDPDETAGILWNISAKDEASREFDYNRIGGEFNLTPTIPLLAMGMTKPLGGTEQKPPLQFRWRPFVGIDAGTVTSGRGNAANGADDVFWLTGRAVAKLKLNFIAQWFKLNEVSLFVDEKVTYLSEVGTWHSYVKAGANFMFNDHVGFSLDYGAGEDTPKFETEEILSGAFTVKF